MQNLKEDDSIDLSKLLGSMWDNKWLIATTTAVFGVLGLLYAFLATPIYTANATIQIEEKSSNAIFKGVAEFFEQNSSATTEIGVLKSRMVLGKSIEDLNLATSAQPTFTIPFLSKGFARLMGDTPNITIPHFTAHKPEFKDVVLEIGSTPNSYRLWSEDGDLLLEGQLNRKYVTDAVTIQVSLLEGKEGQKFDIRSDDPLLVMETLQKTLNIAEKGKQTGLIEISFNGESPRHIERVVRSISENYILQNVARNSLEASKSLEFLQTRLPEVREKLAQSENELNTYLQNNGSVDLGLEVKSVLDTLIQIEADLNALALKESELSRKFTKRHPSYVTLLEQRRVLESEKERLSKEVGELPDTQKEIIRLKRDLEVDQQIYIQLLNKVQELDIIKAGIGGNVRILDVSQVMPKPVSPKKALILVISLLVGVFIGMVGVMIKYLLQRGIESTDEVEALGLPSYASIPYSNDQLTYTFDDINKKQVPRTILLSEANPADLSVEALRSLRTSLHFAMLEAENNIVMLAGTSPEVGKSFIASNLANVIHKNGQRVLLIDLDLRRSYLHYTLNIERNKAGLVEYLAQNATLEDVVRQTQYGFDVILKGGQAPNPSELLASRRCEELLRWASMHYDLVILDTPPILAVTDAAVVGRQAGTCLLIGRFERTSVREIELARQAFERAGVNLKGFILNGVKRKLGNRYEYYHYEYK